MKAQIVMFGDFYAVRYKKWYQFKWTYVSQQFGWREYGKVMEFCLIRNKEDAEFRLSVITGEPNQIVVEVNN